LHVCMILYASLSYANAPTDPTSFLANVPSHSQMPTRPQNSIILAV
jgi:hypothetical protein